MPWNSWLIIPIFIFGSLTYFVLSASSHAEAVTQEMDIDTMPNGSRIFEIQRDGVTYIVVQCHRGIGICKK